jgi:hypothetical protein
MGKPLSYTVPNILSSSSITNSKSWASPHGTIIIKAAICVPNLTNVNLCLLGSLLKRYSKDYGKLWKTIVDAKYNTQDMNIFCSRIVGVSHFWKGLMWFVKSVQFRYRWKIGNGVKLDSGRIRGWALCLLLFNFLIFMLFVMSEAKLSSGSRTIPIKTRF